MARLSSSLFAAGVLRDGLGSLADGVLAEFSGKVEANGCLDLAACDGVLLVVVRQPRGLGGDALKDVVHERVHDAHRLAGDACVRVYLSQDLVDIDGVALFAGLSLLLLALSPRGFGFDGGGFLFAFLNSHFSWHGFPLESGLPSLLAGVGQRMMLAAATLFLSYRGGSFWQDQNGFVQSNCSAGLPAGFRGGPGESRNLIGRAELIPTR